MAGVNSKVQLAELERRHQLNIANALLEQGVTLLDPARIDVRGELVCGRDVTIDVGCVFEGRVELADGVTVGAHSVLVDTQASAPASRSSRSATSKTRWSATQSQIGPYARLRPGTELGEDVHIGNFVEVKNSQVAAHSKANHLAYVGDADVGSRVNIGAGTITCNYDGANKFRTIIEDDAFIGSDSQLVAPVTVGKGATLGAGTTLTKDAPAGKLTISRPKQIDHRKLGTPGQGQEVSQPVHWRINRMCTACFKSLCTGLSTVVYTSCRALIHRLIHGACHAQWVIFPGWPERSQEAALKLIHRG